MPVRSSRRWPKEPPVSDDTRDAIAAAICFDVCAEGDHEAGLHRCYVVADAVLAKLAEGAYQRAVEATGHAGGRTRTAVAATLGIDPSEVPS